MTQEGSNPDSSSARRFESIKEKASGKSLDLSKAFISSVLYIFLEVDCIKMRFYTSMFLLILIQKKKPSPGQKPPKKA